MFFHVLVFAILNFSHKSKLVETPWENMLKTLKHERVKHENSTGSSFFDKLSG